MLRFKRRENRPNNAQALIEMMIFGAIAIGCLSMLIRHIMYSVHTQEENMKTFRTAGYLAKQQGAAGYTGESAVMSIQDKLIPSAEDNFADPARTPIGSFATVTISNNLFGRYDYNDDNISQGIADDLDIPGVYININNLEQAGRADEMLSNHWGINCNRYLSSYWQAGRIRMGVLWGAPIHHGPRKRQLIDFDEEDEIIQDSDWERTPQICWRWEDITWQKIFEKGGGSYDLDYDDKVETIIGVEGDAYDGGWALWLDMEKGEIDSGYSSQDFVEGREKLGIGNNSVTETLKRDSVTKSKNQTIVRAYSENTIHRKVRYKQAGTDYSSGSVRTDNYDEPIVMDRTETWTIGE